MLDELKNRLKTSLANSLEGMYSDPGTMPDLEIEVPKDKTHGDLSINIALKSAKILKKNPMAIAEEMIIRFNAGLKKDKLEDKVEALEIKNPGFINIRLSRLAVYEILYDIFRQQEEFGRSSFGTGQKIQLEFVSANPTGPLSVAHARQAAFGDALANILSTLGFDVKKEYYVNDEGNQINLLGASVRIQAQRLLAQQNQANPPDEEVHYRGEYIIDMAKDFLTKFAVKSQEDLMRLDKNGEIARYAGDHLLKVIQKELEDFHVAFDVWSYQSKIATPVAIEKMFAVLKTKGYLYEKDGALWFQSTTFGDDKDRVVKKSNGSYTYLAPDIVYHDDKFKRGFHKVINVWGPDHHGYIPRLNAAVQALGQSADALQVIIVQLATIYREGKPVSMSTRSGQYIQLREVMEEVGVDAARFFFLMRHTNAHLDFDLELAKKETPENPVYYIQYAHARIHSIIAKARETHIEPKRTDLAFLAEKEEIDLIKLLGHYPEVLMMCYRELDTFALLSYMIELANSFHKFYDCHRVLDLENISLSSERLALIDAVRIVLSNGLRLLGISRPQKM